MTDPTHDPVTRDPFKEMVLDAICGAGFSSTEQASKYERRRLARFDGNQHNERWVWDRAQLAYIETAHLQELYQELKQTQWAREREYAAKAIVSLLKKTGPASDLKR